MYKVLRRIFRITISKILLVVFVLSLALAFRIDFETQRKSKQRDAIQFVTERGGRAFFLDYKGNTTPLFSSGFQITRLNTQEDFEVYSDETCAVYGIDGLDKDFGDDELSQLRGLTKLKILCLSKTNISDDGLHVTGRFKTSQ